MHDSHASGPLLVPLPTPEKGRILLPAGGTDLDERGERSRGTVLALPLHQRDVLAAGEFPRARQRHLLPVLSGDKHEVGG